MFSAQPKACRMTGCEQGVHATLAREFLCLDHFVEQTLTRARHALDQYLHGHTMDQETLDWLFGDAQAAVWSLAQNASGQSAAQREKILELLLCVANIRDYLRHHSMHLAPSE